MLSASNRAIAGVILVLLLASLACNLRPEEPDTQATVQAVYETITAQASLGPLPTDTPLVTDTPTPSPTGTPTITPTPPESRTGNGTNFAIPRCTGTITIDGDATDWGSTQKLELAHNTYGKAEWLGIDDLSGAVRLCWTQSALYLFVEVTDDAHVQTEQGKTSWKGDEVELLFDGDLRGDFYEDVWNDDDTQIGLSPGDFDDIEPAAVRYHPTVEEKLGAEIAARRPIGTGGNYVLEAAVPWSLLRLTPQTDTNYGMCLALSDNDHAGVAQQDSMVSHCTQLTVPDPTTWVTISLTP